MWFRDDKDKFQIKITEELKDSIKKLTKADLPQLYEEKEYLDTHTWALDEELYSKVEKGKMTQRDASDEYYYRDWLNSTKIKYLKGRSNALWLLD